MLWHGRTGLSWHRSAGTGGTASACPLADRAAGAEPGRGGAGGRRTATDGQYLAQALPRAGRGRRAGRAAGVAAARQGAADGGGGRPSEALDRGQNARPVTTAVRLVDLARGARLDRTPVRQAAWAVDRAALFAALGHDPAKALGARQGAPARGDRGLARDHLSRDRQTPRGR
jgi:hypothetical protein